MMYWYLKVVNNYFGFTGRARRSEYWYFALVNLFNSVLTSYMDVTFETFNEENGLGLFNTIYGLLILTPNIAVGIRRMHDVGKSGWYLLIPIYNIVLFATPGIIGENEYGSDPKDEQKETSEELIEK